MSAIAEAMLYTFSFVDTILTIFFSYFMTVTLPTFQYDKFGFLLKALIFFAWLTVKDGNGWVGLV
jgi:hypothetical protein